MGYCHATQPSPVTILPLLYFLFDPPISLAFYSIDQNYDYCKLQKQMLYRKPTSMAEAATDGATSIHDLSDVILQSILASMTDTKARNVAALIGWKWLVSERGTRTSLTLNGNAIHSKLYKIPTYFSTVTHLDFQFIFFAMPFRW